MTASTARVQANGIEIAYDGFGDRSDPPILLVMGLGTQRIAWPDDLCEELAATGHFVVRFDNRDTGESTHLHHLPAPSKLDILLRRDTPYHLDDMADDVVGLIDALELGPVHLVGASMGGFISQTVALRHPDRIRTLTLIMTSTGSRLVGRPSARVLWRLIRRRPEIDRERVVDATLATYRVIGSPGYPTDEEYLRRLAATAYDRGHNPDGYQRHIAAILLQPNRTRQLGGIGVPTLVMHGLADPLVNPSGGLAIARAIPDATFVGFSGMGHDLPRALWPEFARQIHTLVTGGPRAVRSG